MPTIICNYCQYVGSGTEHIERINDVEDHEKTCKENPDYEDEYEIDECEIRTDDWGDLVYKGNTASNINIDSAFHNPDFIGFKFADGSWHDAPIKPVGPDGRLRSGNITVDDIVSGRVQILHATHVLFRQKKQE